MRKIIEARTTSTYKYYGVILTMLGYFIAIHVFQFLPLASIIISMVATAIFLHSHFYSLTITYEEISLQVGKISVFRLNLEEIKDLDNVNIRDCPFGDEDFQVFNFRLIDNKMKAYTIKSCFLKPREVLMIIRLINEFTLGRKWEKSKLKIK